MKRVLLLILTALAAIVAVPAARAVVLDWDTVTWTPGSYNGAYDIDPSKPGNDISINITNNNGAPLQPELVSPYPTTPAISPSFQGGLPVTENTLCIALDLQNNTQSVTVAVSFSAQYTQGVNNVSFKIFDIDYANAAGSSTYQDLISNIRALSIDGITLIAPTITTSLNNTLAGTGLSQTVTGTASTQDIGPNSGDANVTIDFGTNAIQSFSFTYGGGPAFADPTYQHIGLHDISFTPVPEINPALLSIFSCLTAAGVVLHHRAKARK